MNKIIIGIIAVIVIVAGVIAFYPRHSQLATGVSPAGSLNTTGQIAFESIQTGTTTFASFYNAGPDRVITNAVIYLPAVGTTATTTVATSTNPVTNTGATAFTFANATSSTAVYTDTSTVSSAGLRLWPAGTYLNFINTVVDATSTGGIMGVKYLNL